MDPLIGLFDPMEDDTDGTLDNLPPELEEGNIEYKLKLVCPSESRIEHLVTQMKWRLQEGQGEAIYEIGVEDSGLLAGLSPEEMEASLHTLRRMADKLGADISILRERCVDGSKSPESKKVAEVLVRKVPENQEFIDMRLAVLGNVDAGKSTLLGVLTQGERDNGRGRARLNLFRHLHEIQSGRTSSICHEILGFNSKGEVVNYSGSRTAAEICSNSTKVIQLLDLCGHQKYLKTTITGLTGYYPDFAMLVVSANTGIVGTTKEHLGFALALEVPIFVVVSKADLCTGSQRRRTLRQLGTLIKSPGCKRVPFLVESEDDAVTAAATFHNESICPIFVTSSVTRMNLGLLTCFLNLLPPLRSNSQRENAKQEHAEYEIDVVYSVSGVGTVVGGHLLHGTVREGDKLQLGPTEDGAFHPVSVASLHRNRMACRMVAAGQAACLSVCGIPAHITVRKGMVVISPEIEPTACLEFEAEVFLLFHTGYICRGFQTVVHVGNVCQTAKIIKINRDCIKVNQKATVRLRFINRPEYIRLGTRLLFREGRTKGMGQVSKIYPFQNDEPVR